MRCFFRTTQARRCAEHLEFCGNSSRYITTEWNAPRDANLRATFVPVKWLRLGMGGMRGCARLVWARDGVVARCRPEKWGRKKSRATRPLPAGPPRKERTNE